MKLILDETRKRGLIDPEGPVTVRNIAEVKELAESALRQVDVLELDDRQAEVDLTALQLGCSLKRTALKQGKRIVFPTSPTPAASKVIEDAGMCFHAGCQLSGDRCFFWKRGLD